MHSPRGNGRPGIGHNNRYACVCVCVCVCAEEFGTSIYLLFQYFISISRNFMRSPRDLTDSDNVIPRNLTPEVLQALRAVRFIAQHIKDADKDNEVGTPQLPCPLLLGTVRGTPTLTALLWRFSYAHFLSLLLFILAFRLPLIIVYCSQLQRSRARREKEKRRSRERESQMCNIEL